MLQLWIFQMAWPITLGHHSDFFKYIRGFLRRFARTIWGKMEEFLKNASKGHLSFNQGFLRINFHFLRNIFKGHSDPQSRNFWRLFCNQGFFEKYFPRTLIVDFLLNIFMDLLSHNLELFEAYFPKIIRTLIESFLKNIWSVIVNFENFLRIIF